MAEFSATEVRCRWYELIEKVVSSHAAILITRRGSNAGLVPAEVLVSRAGAIYYMSLSVPAVRESIPSDIDPRQTAPA
jgi:PHD/YefM family antitoxin component YafN of YafNO toxin-antitoxin module